MKLIDYQQTIGRIQTILTSENDPSEDVLRDVAEEFAEAISGVNRRLLECDECLHKGLRAEALQLADVEPNLLDAFAVLDCPELSAWVDYIGQFDIDAPPELRLDSAAELNEAYSAAEPLEKLLRKHRKLAIARASLTERTETLRELVLLDGDNNIWVEDLSEYEQHRLSLMQKECDQAIRRKDLGVLGDLERELLETPWIVETPGKLKAKIRKHHDRIRADNAYAEMTDLAHQLSDAFSALDINQGRTLFGRWNALQKIANVEPSDEVFDLAGPALDWLQQEHEREQEEEAYKASLHALETTLDGDCTREELDRQYHQARRHDRELPPVLEHRVVERIKALEAKSTRRNRFIVACTVGVFLIVGALVVFFVRENVHAQEVARHATQFSQLIKAGNLSDARSYHQTLEQSQPDIVLEPEISGLAAQLRDAERAEEGRFQQFEELYTAASDILLRNPRWDDLDKADSQAEQAMQIAAPNERAKVKRLQGEIWQKRQEMQSEVDTQFQVDFDDIQNEIDRIEGLDDTPIESYQALIKRLNELKDRPFVSDRKRGPVPGLIARVEGSLATTRKRIAVMDDLARITQNVGRSTDYVAALRGYTKDHPGTSRSGEFTDVLRDEQELWAAVNDWMTIRSRWKLISLKSMTPSRAEALLAEYDEFKNRKKGYPGETRLDERTRATRAALSWRLDSGKGLLGGLERVFEENRAITDMLLVSSGGKNYYTNEVPEKNGSRFNIKYFTDLNFSQKNSTSLQVSEVEGGEDKNARSAWTAPQTAFAKDAVKLIAAVETRGWEESFASICDRLMSYDDMDPYYRVVILGEVLRVGSQGSVFLNEALKPALDTISQSRLPRNANWIGPGDSGGNNARIQANTLMVQLRSLPSLFEKAVALREDVQKQPLGPAMRWVGWLHRMPPAARSTTETWTCSVRNEIASRYSGDLVVVYLDSQAQSAPRLAQIGTLVNGQPEIDNSIFATNKAVQVEGRPVYVASVD